MAELSKDKTPEGRKQIADSVDWSAAPPHVQALHERVQRIEDKLWPPVADGSGTERYDNWTQHSNGTDYPGSYGVGPETVHPAFVPFTEAQPESSSEPEPKPEA